MTADFLEKISADTDREIKRFVGTITGQDPITMITRCHLYVESVLSQTIEQALPDPGAIDLTRISFSHKLDFAVALKLVPAGDKRGFAKLNAIRNQLSHDFDAMVSERDQKELRDSLSEGQKAIFKQFSLNWNPGSTSTELTELRPVVAALGASIMTCFLIAKHVSPEEAKNT